jgi:hypothetical protein
MNKFCLLTLISITLIGLLFRTPDRLVGKWIFRERYGDQNGFEECPDTLVFYLDVRYEVLNECYGIEIKNPVTEHGKWKFDDRNNEILFSQREFSANHFFYDSLPTLKIVIKKLTKDSLMFCVSTESCEGEVFERVKDHGI